MDRKIISDVAQKTGLPEKLIEDTYKAYWKYIKDSIESLPLKENLSREDFSKLRTNFNIPSLGKLVCTFDKYKKLKYYYKKYEETKKDKTDV